MELAEVLQHIQAELLFYRKRYLSIHYFSLLIQVLLISGKATILIKGIFVTNLMYLFVFISVVILNVCFSNSYAERIHKIREIRCEILNNAGYCNVLPKHEYFKTKSPNWLYSITIAMVSTVGVLQITIKWFT